ncbi:hypothetical protein O6H91_01G045500 [Diphasiastrum complanatum]|uniref:Uncharacterized protein n=2 Tax=Diphasiastrum complanatum TaxID=34168 RepID=A0ACC2CN16_DIPCM|nr:hypothetical protein O6H91_09G036900 [Diphasiastrum complanatum]KAJ7568719.1 hypothetical protein O6H91_01G045500 [Diphasiastrum complanatum]
MAHQAHMERRGRPLREQAQEALHKLQERAPSLFSKDAWIAAITVAVVLVGVGLAFAGTSIAVVVSAPFLIVASPILIPLGVVLFLAAAGVLLAAAVSVTLLLGVSWLYKYVKGEQLLRADQIDAVRRRFFDTASQVTERARESCGYNVAEHLHLKERQAAPGA